MTHDEAIAAGYKDETCPKCGTLFEAQIHFVRCEVQPCPMVSTKDSRTLLQRWCDDECEFMAPQVETGSSEG
jgi:hypothetical protein